MIIDHDRTLTEAEYASLLRGPVSTRAAAHVTVALACVALASVAFLYIAVWA